MNFRKPPSSDAGRKAAINRSHHFLLVASILFFSLLLHFSIAKNLYGKAIEQKEMELKAAYAKQMQLQKKYDKAVADLHEIMVFRKNQIESAEDKIRVLKSNRRP